MKLYLRMILFFPWLIAAAQEENLNLKDYNAFTYALIEASRQKMVGNINESIVLYKKCLDFKPDCNVAYYELGTIYSALGDNLKAETNLASAYNLDQDNFWYAIAYSDILKINEKKKESIKVLEKIRNDEKENNLNVEYRIAENYVSMEKYRKAIKILDKIEKGRGISEMITLKKSEIYLKDGKTALAEKEILRLIEEVPDFAGYRIVVAEFYLEIGDTMKAVNAYENALELDSSNILVITTLSDLLLKKHEYQKSLNYLQKAFESDDIDVNAKFKALIMLIGDSAIIQEHRKDVELLIEKVLIKYPENIDLKTVAYDFYNKTGNQIFAFALIKQILEERKDVFVIWQQAIYNANMIENYDEMILICNQALKYFPNKAELYLMAGLAYYQKEDFENAFNKLKEGLNFVNVQDEYRIQYYVFLAESAYRTKRIAESFGFYEELIKIAPENNMVKNNYSYFLALENTNLKKAEQLSKETIDNEPNNSVFLDTYGWILFVMGKLNEAKIYIQEALKYDKEADKDILFHYAEILLKLGEVPESREYYIKAKDKGYDVKIIDERLKLMKTYE